MRTDAQKKADRKYRQKSQVILRYSLNAKTDSDIIEFWKAQENKLSLFKKLTRNYIGNPQAQEGADADILTDNSTK